MTAWLLQPRWPTNSGGGQGGVFIPHPAPNAAGNEDDHPVARMRFLSLLKTIVLPALIGLILYLIITHVIVPLWQRHRGRYSNYLPLDTISTSTTTARQRIQTTLVSLLSRLLPASLRTDWTSTRQTVSAEDGSSDFDEDEGEELDDIEANRREALSLDVRRGADDSGRRLSRDVEETFKDDSDDEYEVVDTRRRSMSRS